MTEAEWLACADPAAMLDALGERASERKLRLFGYACCRRAAHLLPDERSWRAVEFAAAYADGAVTAGHLWDACEAAAEAEEAAPNGPAYSAALAATCLSADDVTQVDGAAAWAAEALAGGWSEEVRGPADGAAFAAERREQAVLLRDVFGRAFRPVALDPSWLTSAAVSLARGIYADQAFDRLPILADALQDAGCEQPDILAHCRAEGPHARGCWVVDLVLGKG